MSDFPCKLRPGAFDITTMNTIPVGVPQPLSFIGGATHGGGSCQVSVTLDKEPTKNSQWKVIHSIIGGCPSNATGNLSGNPAGTDASVFEFSVPTGMPNGQYTLAWTWFNKIGNREMYMNCAPITVTGGGSDNSVFDTLPDMFVLNIAEGQCQSVEGEDFAFPSPGASVETGALAVPGSSMRGSGCASVTKLGAGAGSAGSPAAPTATPATSYAASSSDAATTTAALTSSGPAATGGAVSGSSDSVVTMTTTSTVTTTASSVPSSSAAATSIVPVSSEARSSGSSAASGYSAASGFSRPSDFARPSGTSRPSGSYGSYGTQRSNSGSDNSSSGSTGATSGSGNASSGSTASTGSCTGGRIPCTKLDEFVCIGKSEFGICEPDNCATPQPLAQGTTCTNGNVQKRSMRVAQHMKGPHLRRMYGHL
ncbi:hypothetical protein LTR16_003451 [Cryomyces antarcticus]|uniref:Chitin-binding type-4 domain-containing protein n=1 Tax=Cryomyces antarcticus TaxID=329879 RepID=A0ABR0KSI1_9PEZI|nr:hypothetical protein LTR16_003451 [Cryomyces antarcticus]